MAKSPEAATVSMIENLEEKTGRSLAEWVRIAQTCGKEKHGDIVAFLKSRHGLGHGYANLVVHKAREAVGAPAGSEDLVTAQYAGPKAVLRPIYDKLIAAVQEFGAGVEISPKKTYVSLRRSKQFALIQPSTATRLDVGINLKGAPAGKRLEASGSFNAMVSHRVRLERVDQVDAELIQWLRQAFDAA
jgi:predicted transport protein